ncbi:hypothetical protein [Clostridium estertheticum]|nr:hypothetical protein [Clostridium estertheticum]
MRIVIYSRELQMGKYPSEVVNIAATQEMINDEIYNLAYGFLGRT